MKFWRWLKSAARHWYSSSHGDEYLAQLKSFGVDARRVKSGSREASYNNGMSRWRRYGNSLVTIRFDGYPAPVASVRWKKKDSWGDWIREFFFVEYFVPDARMTEDLRGFSLKVKYEETMESYGDTSRAYWTGRDLDTGLAQRLNADCEITRGAMLFFGDYEPLTINTDCGKKIWIIRSSADAMPIREHFDTYQAIARHLIMLDVL